MKGLKILINRTKLIVFTLARSGIFNAVRNFCPASLTTQNTQLIVAHPIVQKYSFRGDMHKVGTSNYKLSLDDASQGIYSNDGAGNGIEKSTNRVKLEKLETEPASIEDLHRTACLKGSMFYVDPASGYNVMTEAAHLKRGKCCGNACRHCPFDHVNVKERESKRTIKYK